MDPRPVTEPEHLEGPMTSDEAFVGALAARSLYDDSDFDVVVVRGPNRRNDFHVDPHDEFFFQVRGSIRVDTRTPETGLRRHLVREGQAFLVPGGVRHSPHRPAGSLGIVVEIRRRRDDLEAAEWWCEGCDTLIERVEMRSSQMIESLGPILEAFNADPQRRTCRSCGISVPVPKDFVLEGANGGGDV